jgi:phosphoglycolate phosphatase
MSLKSVFFDLDGTLLDTSYDLGNALNFTLENQGFSALSQEKIRPHVSNGSVALIKFGFGENIDEHLSQKYRAELLDYYLAHIAEHTAAFEGICELIETCRQNNLNWGIVTNKPKTFTLPLMNQIKLPSRPCAIVCPDDLGISKPRPEPLLHACQLAHCTPSEAIYIGRHERLQPDAVSRHALRRGFRHECFHQ